MNVEEGVKRQSGRKYKGVMVVTNYFITPDSTCSCSSFLDDGRKIDLLRPVNKAGLHSQRPVGHAHFLFVPSP